MKFFILVSLLLFVHASPCNGKNHPYECRKADGHVIHIVTLNPQFYTIDFIKAHNQVFGRETIEAIAKRTGADIAINAGFFEIGNAQDGMPSGTLIINQQVLGINLKKHACLIHNQHDFKIQEITPHLEIKIGKNVLTPTKVNKLCEKNDVILYSHLWGSQTLTPLKERQEIAINKNNEVVVFSKQGNIAIPQDGFVLSLPVNLPLNSIAAGDEAMVLSKPFGLSKGEKESAVMGIPILVQGGKINAALLKNQEDFYKSPHARTALGTRSDGTVVIVVAEHIYQKPLQDVTLREVKSLIGDNKAKIISKYKKTSLNHLTVAEIKEIVAKDFTTKDSAVGLSLRDLATLMLELDCEAAINLDGGGSSSLFINDRVINRTVGDKEEGMGRKTLRPLSDAIVFKDIY
jgi:exopolysaccharide biosynthesis protein